MELPRLYGVTDEGLLPGNLLVARVRVAVEAGLRMVQVRFKATPPGERLRQGRELRAITRAHGAMLIVNDRPDLAAEIEADGAHVGADDVAVESAREMLGPDAVVGMSAYGDESLVREAGRRGASYIGLSSPFPSPTKPKPSPDRTTFRRLADLSPVPAFAIGGLTHERAADLLPEVHGVAVVSALFGAEDVAAATRAFLRLPSM
jgi:thiamine-phosphate pyrophosphorylase